ncbi:pyruvate dehydrogenase complex dihydrolipoamide acetyltransferase [Sphingopyxis terrae]|uniref:Acetyltransferase component of pyruvate dehydrogenase complex n=1 Tax=Sphingopyxis terrae subsp. ummariensis TaxID=429001 RepID=A0A1Y6ECX9_9SPHN|nr:pyruvate dehydrogenase complex dihydrolipoamide acetyltransferase [Sphingopyxis terrae]PCF92852.1 pyruvate dehydrogenase complex dihydrolipoamide acetyltransferase [Sphingopyxis terrae subsp. ummariensis]SMQ58770.1 pyruvate dehydrogenase E2 component (dihydrolipoamide acetyltransferase) [Sphingopyxis terrae subsp. ummariensis]
MPIELKMPALSPTMEEGTLAKWLVKEGDSVQSGDLLAEIETDKATMEFEAVDEGTIAQILIPEGTDNVKVGTVIAVIAGEDEDAGSTKVAPTPAPAPAPATVAPAKAGAAGPAAPTPAAPASAGATATSPAAQGERIKASPLAKRIAADKGIDLAALTGSGPGGRIVKADLEGAATSTAAPATAAAPSPAPAAAPAPAQPFETDIPHSAEKLSNMRKTIARRLTQSKQEVPHIYLTVDVQLDKLLRLRGELNAALEPQGVKLSVNDLLIKALAKALIQVPKCNVSFAGDQLISYERADISVAVSVPAGLITPIIVGADDKSVSKISTEMKELAGRAKEGKLQPHEYQGGTASLSNMGMFGIKQFEAVINPPQGMIMAIGAGEKRPYVVDDALAIATVMSATGSFDHRAIDGADGAQLMQAFKQIVENPLGLVA